MDCYRHLECIGLGVVPFVNSWNLVLNGQRHVFQKCSFFLKPMFGESMRFVQNHTMKNLIDTPFPITHVDKSLVFVETWKRKIQERVSQVVCTFPIANCLQELLVVSEDTEAEGV